MKAADALRRRRFDGVVGAGGGRELRGDLEMDFRVVAGDSFDTVELFDALHFAAGISLLQVAADAETRVDQKVGSVENARFALKSSLPL